MRRNALRTRIARTILSLLFVMSFSVSAPAFALTDAECRLSNGGTCEYSNCNSGEQKIGDCSDNIAQKTCCVSSASGITAPKQFSYSDCANISEADCSNPIVKSTCAIQCVDCNDVKSIATCSDLNILGKCPTQCTSLCSGSNLTPVNAGNCGDCVAITTYGEAHGYPSGILDSVKSTCYNIPGADAAIKKAEDDACPELDKGCCTKVINPGDANGVGRVTKTVCQGKPTITSGDCYCIANGVVSPPKSNLTYAACANACHEDGGQIDTTQGIGRLPPSGYGATGKPLEQSVNAMCFKPEDCADQGGEFTFSRPSSKSP